MNQISRIPKWTDHNFDGMLIPSLTSTPPKTLNFSPFLQNTLNNQQVFFKSRFVVP
jgi:hypothetical protein